jgi:hypothetical protein
MKERFYVVASALASYMGVGFNTVDEQLEIDLGHIEKEFDDAAQERMDLGNCMEEGCLNFFEKKLGIIIDERNSEYKYAVNGLLMCKRDGRTFIDGVETGVENKYSNSSSECFTDSFGYELQCQAYMMAWGLDQWLLCGMWQGKPKMKLIKANKELQKDIEELVTKVAAILTGIASKDDYPWEIVEKYSKQNPIKSLEDPDLEDYDKELLHRIGELKDEISMSKKELDELETYAKTHFADSTYKDADYKYVISTSTRKGDIDKDRLSIEHPDIDIESYRKPSTSYQTLRVTSVKHKAA